MLDQAQWLVAIPLVVGMITMILPSSMTRTARWLTLLSALYTVASATMILATGNSELTLIRLGASDNWTLPLQANGVTATLCLLTAVVYATSVTTSWRRVQVGVTAFHGLLSLLVAGVFGVFLTEHLLYFFVFYELAVLPMYVLIGVWGSTKPIDGKGPFAQLFADMQIGTRAYGAMKLTIYLLLGSAALLAAIFMLFALREQSSGQGSFLISQLMHTPMSATMALTIFGLSYFGFGVLAGIWPFHTWSPDGHAAAPPAASMMHAGVLMKLGAFGVMRVGFLLLPEASDQWSTVIGTIAVINILYGALAAFWQTDFKYLIAYSSVSHMGVVMLGLAAGNRAGWTGSVMQMVAHGLMTALFFTLAGIIYEEKHERNIGRLQGLGKQMPGLSIAWMIAVLSSLGMPGLAGFVAELHVFLGAWQHNMFWGIAGAVGAWLTAIYLLRVTRAMFQRGEATGHGHDLQGTDWITPVVLCTSLLVLGIWPRLLLDHIEPQVIIWLASMAGGGQ